MVRTNDLRHYTMAETVENRRKRLIFRSWHRGTREMDLLLGRFADSHVPGFDEGQLGQYEALLDCPDPDLYDWYAGRAQPPQDRSPILALFLSYKMTGA